MSSKGNKLDLNNLKLSLMNRHNGKLKMAAIFALLVSTVTFNLGFANETDKEKFAKIYHVYVANTYVGAVADEATINEVVQQKELEASEQYENLAIDASADLTIIPEQVFKVEANEEQTLRDLQEALTVQAQAYSLQVGETVVASLKDKAEFEAVIDGLKLQYVTQKQLNELENNSTNESLPELKKDETRLIDVDLSAPITGQEMLAKPAEIVSVQQAVQLLQTGSQQQETYTVKAGDVLGSIAKAHHLTTAQLLSLNPSLTADSVLQIDQQLNVTVEKPFVTVKAIYEKKKDEEIDFAKIVEEDETMLKGEKVVKQEGSKGKKEVSYLITEENGVRTERVQSAENVLVEPENRVVVVGTKVIPSIGTGTFAWPAFGGYISSNMGHRWGRYHYGIDIARPSNYTIKASDNGVVKTAGTHSTYGNYVVIDHNNGFETLYAHLSRIDVSVGQVLEQGSALGQMGSTGRSTGTHLHFEIHKDGAEVNPLSYLN
ncbi:peptidoglycan DD-metalloendopeptidase family protein [Solibacillus silvestris]|uniref:peptidoglycan DD-metalloendopeptidase family protein n=1 Tax=Solibacillus silvestris TaxID=76853 RepID=UPI003F819BD3